MARNDRDRLIKTFVNMNRNRRRKPGLNVTTPNISGTSSSYRPSKQGVVPNRSRKRLY